MISSCRNKQEQIHSKKHNQENIFVRECEKTTFRHVIHGRKQQPCFGERNVKYLWDFCTRTTIFPTMIFQVAEIIFIPLSNLLNISKYVIEIISVQILVSEIIFNLKNCIMFFDRHFDEAIKDKFDFSAYSLQILKKYTELSV